MIINKNEAKSILSKKQTAITRYYPTGCKYEAKSKLTLKAEVDGKLQDMFYCTVRSVRPVSVADYNERTLADEKPRPRMGNELEKNV